eukprot:gene12658-6558_t
MINKELYDKVSVNTDEIPFKFKQIGTLPELEVCEINQVSSTMIPLEDERDILDDLKKEFLELEELKEDERMWPRQINYDDFYNLETSNCSLVLEFENNPYLKESNVLKEYQIPEMSLSSIESSSILRQPSESKDFVRGSSQNLMFSPGGFIKNEKTWENKEVKNLSGEEELNLLTKSNGLCTIPHGFKRGLKISTISKEISSIAPVSVGKNTNGFLDEFKVTEKDLIHEEEIKQTKMIKEKKNFVTLDQDFFTDSSEIILEEKQEEIKHEIKTPKKKSTEEIDDLLLDVEDFSVFKDEKKNEFAVMESMDISNFDKLIPNMVIQYPFDLDKFQKEAIYHLEQRENVFVAAHTSAGKTVVAEYAIALAKKHFTRAIYTSPIKTLSNQKFREFKKTFEDVGILTGDVQINPTATCLIMTTEILRSMLYKGADLIRDVEYVIFDEVHYINDSERGVVWEEVIIMLPEHINLIFLSATIPNTYEFADWIGRTKRKPIYVMSTLKRPVPLEFHIYYSGDIFKIVDSTSTFLVKGYKSALQAKKDRVKFRLKKNMETNEWAKLIEVLKKKKLIPLIVFSFSRKKCEDSAFGLSTVDLTTSSEKSKIHVFFENSISRLSKVDRTLPQVIRMRDLVSRGIGVHHSGLLPIVKEMVEMLFGRGLLKVLFATETFAMGVNMPAKCVVFNGLRKHDGKDFRDLLPAEFIQMSGRAGRRGLDTVGMVMMIAWDEIPEEPLLQKLILGKANKLESQFRLTYNMMLNLLRVEDFRVEDMMKRSFSESQTQKFLPNSVELYDKGKQKLDQLDSTKLDFYDESIEAYYKNAKELENLNSKYHTLLFRTANSAFVSGRVLVIKTREYGNTLGILLKQLKGEYFEILVLKLEKVGVIFPSSIGLPAFNALLLKSKDEGDVIETNEIVSIINLKVNIIKKSDYDSAIPKLINLWENSKLIEITPKNMKINSFEIVDLFNRKQNCVTLMKESICWTLPKFKELFEYKDKQESLRVKLNTMKYALSDQNLGLLPEYEKRINVLQKLNYLDKDNTVLLKGRVACEINSCDELLVTEMIFENFFTSLEPEECVSILSCLICQDKTESEVKLTDNLLKVKENLRNLSQSLGKLQMEFGMDTSPTEYCSLLNFYLMEVSYEWAKGMPFSEITDLTNILEGSIVRSITQIDQACREVRNAARVIGDSKLYQKMEEASLMIKRDIVFAASLYVV